MSPRRTAATLAVAILLILGACAPKHAKPPTLHRGTTTTLVPRPAGFVALGDSYTSGGGASPYDVSTVCGRSSRSWVNVLARLDTALHLVQNEACGGATTTQLLEPWAERQQPAQIPRRADPSVGLVAFTIGGNDVKLAQVIGACATLDCAGVVQTKVAKQNLADLTTRLVHDIYPALRRAYPKARLVHVGYPFLTSEALGDTCPWLAPDEQDEPNDVVQAVDAAIKRATEESGQVEYLDVRHALRGHELCTKEPYVFDVTPGSAAPLHPTAAGYELLGAAIAKGLGQ
jgi:lysophospholipase L1-like esterase